MSFILEKTKETTFSNIDSVLQYVEWEKKNTARISIADLLGQGAFFYNRLVAEFKCLNLIRV